MNSSAMASISADHHADLADSADSADLADHAADHAADSADSADHAAAAADLAADSAADQPGTATPVISSTWHLMHISIALMI